MKDGKRFRPWCADDRGLESRPPADRCHDRRPPRQGVPCVLPPGPQRRAAHHRTGGERARGPRQRAAKVLEHFYHRRESRRRASDAPHPAHF